MSNPATQYGPSSLQSNMVDSLMNLFIQITRNLHDNESMRNTHNRRNFDHFKVARITDRLKMPKKFESYEKKKINNTNF